MPHPKLRTRTAIAAAALAAVAVPVGIGATADASTTRTIKLSGMKFSPSRITIHKRDKIRFVWADGGKTGGHTLVGPHVNVKLQKTGSKTVTFKKAGSFKYICTVHPGMTTIVKVK